MPQLSLVPMQDQPSVVLVESAVREALAAVLVWLLAQLQKPDTMVQAAVMK